MKHHNEQQRRRSLHLDPHPHNANHHRADHVTTIIFLLALLVILFAAECYFLFY